MRINLKFGAVLAVLAGIALVISAAVIGALAQGESAPRFKYDPDWPKPLPNKWRMGGVTGLAVDKDDNVWVLNRPNDLVSIEVHAEQDPPLADCCVHAPPMIHFDKGGNVIGSFDAPQGAYATLAASGGGGSVRGPRQRDVIAHSRTLEP